MRGGRRCGSSPQPQTPTTFRPRQGQLASLRPTPSPPMPPNRPPRTAPDAAADGLLTGGQAGVLPCIRIGEPTTKVLQERVVCRRCPRDYASAWIVNAHWGMPWSAAFSSTR